MLLVEDSPGDVRLTLEAFRESSSHIDLHVATDGVGGDGVPAAARTRHAGCPRPDLILLDLNLPRMDGREVLAQIKGDDEPEDDPDGHPDDLGGGGRHPERATSSRPTAYLTKPVQLDDVRDDS